MTPKNAQSASSVAEYHEYSLKYRTDDFERWLAVGGSHLKIVTATTSGKRNQVLRTIAFYLESRSTSLRKQVQRFTKFIKNVFGTRQWDVVHFTSSQRKRVIAVMLNFVRKFYDNLTPREVRFWFGITALKQLPWLTQGHWYETDECHTSTSKSHGRDSSSVTAKKQLRRNLRSVCGTVLTAEGTGSDKAALVKTYCSYEAHCSPYHDQYGSW